MTQILAGNERVDAPLALPRPEATLASLRRILVPTDGSPFAEHALAWALEIAHRADASIDLAFVNVLPPSVLLGEISVASEWEQSTRDLATSYLESVAGPIRDAEGVEIGTVLMVDPSAARALTRHARSSNADLIVMTTHGRRGIARAWLGSVAEAVLRESAAPVLLLRPDDSSRDLRRRERLFRSMLIAVDGSANSERALEYAAMVGAISGARLDLLWVVDPLALVATGPVPVGTAPAKPALEHERARASAWVAERVAMLRAHGLEADGETTVATSPSHAILRSAERGDAGLVVVGTHGRKGLDRVLLGSVAETVVRGTARPVLVVPRAWQGASA